ncbi:histone H3-K56 acetyltransferase [Penicillium argentinense]|uniref:histone acetyltransferase n=1 Tax=Penicillium argentinense TaxID=1131581 RepID=A0A9W9EWF1_9EURO|nr:histone H3-K56 acetyltransferase [Penicillium argentinense]KAJ5089126.1 histone H3-K56 acetyltransferase [Penicillium argentinense]
MAAEGDLGDLLAKVLPTDAQITVRHVSSTPAPSAALFAAAPGQDTEATFCENHFLSVSIDSQQDDGAEVLVFGMEVMVYNTAHLTTIFVSKADSTGFLHLLKLPRKVSVLRLVANTFLSHLARTHQRPGVRLVISLFARAQDQYLFPGSIENAGKHVLDDRGLIKWWCRSADLILREHEPESVSQDSKQQSQTGEAAKASATAYLIVPGCDRLETRSFYPATAKSDPQDRPRWLNSYPLQQMVHDPSAPPRCLIPRLPDDPKTRFLIDLDDELPEPVEGENASPGTGLWRSVRSLDQFWEMMSFRQECSAGRLVGFLWLVINPPGLMNSTTMASQTRGPATALPTPANAAPSKTSTDDKSIEDISELSKTEESQKALAKIVTAESVPESQEQPSSFDHPPTSQFTNPSPFSWPEAGRGQVVLNEADYKSMMDGILDNFYDEKEIVASTKAYIDQVASLADELTWGKRVTGTHSPEESKTETMAPRNLLDSGLIRKRKKSEGDSGSGAAQPSGPDGTQSAPSQPAAANVLSAGLVRKKKKT